MQVIAESPMEWFLFEENGRVWLDVLVQHEVVSFSVTAELRSSDPQAYVPMLVATMRDRALRREWTAPTLPAGWQERSLEAVRVWRELHPA